MGLTELIKAGKQLYIAFPATSGISQKPCQFWFWLHINNRFLGLWQVCSYAFTRLISDKFPMIVTDYINILKKIFLSFTCSYLY